DYGLQMGSRQVNLTAPYSFDVASAQARNDDYPLTVRIGDTSGKRAGDYSDTLTFTVAAISSAGARPFAPEPQMKTPRRAICGASSFEDYEPVRSAGSSGRGSTARPVERRRSGSRRSEWSPCWSGAAPEGRFWSDP